MTETDANNQCSAACISLRFFLCIIRYFYVRAVLIIVGTLLSCTSWFEFSWTNPTCCYCMVLIFFLCLTFAEKGCFDGRRVFARRSAYQDERQRNIQRSAQQQHQGEQRSAQQLHQGEQMSRLPPWLRGEQPQAELPAAAAPEPIVEIHRPYEPSESPSSGENEPLLPFEHSDPGRNVPQQTAGPSTQSTHNTPMDVRNEAQIDVPSQQTGSSDSGSNKPEISSDPSTHSTQLDVSNEKPRSEESLQVGCSHSGSNLPQSSTNPPTQSTRSVSSDEEHRSDGPLQQADPSDLGSNIPQSSRDTSSQSTSSSTLDEITPEGPQSDE